MGSDRVGAIGNDEGEKRIRKDFQRANHLRATRFGIPSMLATICDLSEISYCGPDALTKSNRHTCHYT